MARMAGWIWSILAVRLLGHASISLMAPARRTVGLDWINRTLCRHAAHTGTPRTFADPDGACFTMIMSSLVTLNDSSRMASGQALAVRPLQGSVIPDVRVGGRQGCYQNVIRLTWLRVFDPGYAQNMSEWLVPGESFQTAWSVGCSVISAHAIPLLPDQWTTSDRKVGWHDQFGWLDCGGPSAPGLYGHA